MYFKGFKYVSIGILILIYIVQFQVFWGIIQDQIKKV
jgi:hypothetical protein